MALVFVSARASQVGLAVFHLFGAVVLPYIYIYIYIYVYIYIYIYI